METKPSPTYIHSNCHPDTPTWANIDRTPQGQGVVTIRCADCDRVVVRLRLAGREVQGGGV